MYIYKYIFVHTYIHTLHYITLHYITIQYNTIQYITLHYITYIHMMFQKFGALEKLMDLSYFLKTNHVWPCFQGISICLTWRGVIRTQPAAPTTGAHGHLDSWHWLAQAPTGVPPTRAGDFNLDVKRQEVGCQTSETKGVAFFGGKNTCFSESEKNGCKVVFWKKLLWNSY